MALSTSVHDLRTLIRSCHPLIAIETVEEERVLTLLQSVAAQERMPLFEWSVTRGLTRADDAPALSKMTATPPALLQHLHGLTVEAIFWLKDLVPHLQETPVARQLEMAESLSPIVLWIDEIEKAMVAGGGSGEADAGLSRRLFGAFLTWLQEKKQEVFVVATANNLSSLPPELLRKGRFDEIFFVDLPDDEERQAIWTIHLTLRKQNAEKFDLVKIISASDGFSGSEIEQAVVAALYRALHQKSSLTTDLLIEELTQTVPLSVTRREDIDQLRTMAQGRFVNVR